VIISAELSATRNKANGLLSNAKPQVDSLKSKVLQLSIFTSAVSKLGLGVLDKAASLPKKATITKTIASKMKPMKRKTEKNQKVKQKQPHRVLNRFLRKQSSRMSGFP